MVLRLSTLSVLGDAARNSEPAGAGQAVGTTYYISTSGDDGNNGTSVSTPFRHIQKAADVMQAGDTCLIRGGEYREKIIPPRGGISEEARITYKAYPGEMPVIKGSERVTGWVDQGGGVWRADLPDSFFGSAKNNPYTLVAGGACINNKDGWHLGMVYLDGVALSEAKTLADCQAAAKVFFASHIKGVTSIYAHFNADPNAALAEVSVRDSCFQPEVENLGYLTISGLTLKQASPPWSGNTGNQYGIITAKVAYKWIIEFCHISDATTTGIALANVNGSTKKSFNEYGFNIVRNNTIERCNESGICGHRVAHSSLIEGNLIQDIGWQRKFSGAEQAGIKFHWAIDTVIKNNIIRRIYPKNTETICAIWLDWANQGARVTGNILYDEFAIGGANHLLLLEANCGPITVDNNIILGTVGYHNTCSLQSTAIVFAHNLIYENKLSYYNSFSRRDPWLTPHTFEVAGIHNKTNPPVNQICRNNFYIKASADVDTGSNVKYSGGQKLSHVDMVNGVSLSFLADDQPSAIKAPYISSSFIGKFQPMNQGMENADGSGFDLATDINGKSRSLSRPKAGPFEDLITGNNSYTFTAGADASNPAANQK